MLNFRYQLIIFCIAILANIVAVATTYADEKSGDEIVQQALSCHLDERENLVAFHMSIELPKSWQRTPIATHSLMIRPIEKNDENFGELAILITSLDGDSNEAWLQKVANGVVVDRTEGNVTFYHAQFADGRAARFMIARTRHARIIAGAEVRYFIPYQSLFVKVIESVGEPLPQP